MANRKIGMLVSAGPASPAFATFLSEASALADGGASLYIYLIDDAVSSLDSQGLCDLARQGGKIFACPFACRERQIDLASRDELVHAGLATLGNIIANTDEFQSYPEDL